MSLWEETLFSFSLDFLSILGVMGPGGVRPVAKGAAGTSHPSLSRPDMMKSRLGSAKPVQEICEREAGRVRSTIQPRAPEKACGGT